MNCGGEVARRGRTPRLWLHKQATIQEPPVWMMIPSMQGIVQGLAPVFTQPSFVSHCQLMLAWLLCPGRRTLYHVGQFHQPDREVDRAQRHPFDWLYNF